jgi:hypothetical protein
VLSDKKKEDLAMLQFMSEGDPNDTVSEEEVIKILLRREGWIFEDIRAWSRKTNREVQIIKAAERCRPDWEVRTERIPSHVRDRRIGFFLNGDTIILHRFLDRKDMYRYFP